MTTWRLESGVWARCVGVPLEDRGFRYGMSVFETVAIHRGRAVFLEEHLDRLTRAAQAVGWGDVVVVRIPEPLWHGHPAHGSIIKHRQDADATDSIGRPADDRNSIMAGKAMPQDITGVVRLYVTAGPGAAGDAFCGSVYALFEECEVGTEFPAVRVASSPVPYLPGPGGWKTGNYWQNVAALASARRMGIGDVLLFNPSGGLVCASMANIFLEVGGVWQTPALEAGTRDGVVRDWVKKQMPVEESLPGPDEVARCTACFLTNSRVGVRAVCEIDGRPLQTDVAALQRLYRDHVL